MGRPYKREAVQLRKQMKKAGFMISGAVDENIELLLERLNQQRIIAAVEVSVHKDVLPSVMAVTQDYAILGKRYPFRAYPDEFSTCLKDDIVSDIKPIRSSPQHTARSCFSANLFLGMHFGRSINDYHNNDRFNNAGIFQIADVLMAGYGKPATQQDRKGPPL